MDDAPVPDRDWKSSVPVDSHTPEERATLERFGAAQNVMNTLGKEEGHGLASVICAGIGLLFWSLLFLFAPAAIILGILQLRKKKSTVAIVGIVLGAFELLFLLFFVGIFAYVFSLGT